MGEFSVKQMRHLAGFGQPRGADAYVFEPNTLDEFTELYSLARSSGRPVSFFGSRQSYGSPIVSPEGIAISLVNFCQVGEIENGLIEVAGGATLDQLWRSVLPQRFWPTVVSGTAQPTIAGAIAMNIHGKNAFKVGTFSESVVEFDLVSPGHGVQTIRYGTPEFNAVSGGAGLHGAVTRAVLKLQPITSGGLRVIARTPRSWEEQIECFEEFQSTADYMVSWVDMFGSGRGQFHAASYAETSIGFDPDAQLRTKPVFGLVPRDQLWRIFRAFTNSTNARILNLGKDLASRLFHGKGNQIQTLAEFSFLLDSAPGWERAYNPDGLLQFQAFVPREAALACFNTLESLQRQVRIISTLGVLKLHRPTHMPLDYSVDGYSLALDFRRQPGLDALCERMTQEVLNHGGKFYLAKDSFLTRTQFETMHSAEKRAEFARWKDHYDPDHLIQSIQSRILGLT